jgi:MFS family permease
VLSDEDSTPLAISFPADYVSGVSITSAESVANTGQDFGSRPYRTYVLITLTAVYTLNFVDRILIGVVAQPIIEEFQLRDWQFGLLSGFGFALMYTLMGLPIARLAERMNRVRIIATCVVLWSAMTALCGTAGGFYSLLAFRVGVGIGEAGCTPPANSLIADYFTARKRAMAFGVYGLGITLGGVLANLFGGPIAQNLSWREAFIYIGIPGVLVGIGVLVTVREPPRGYSDPPGTPPAQRSSFREALRELASKPTYWMLAFAATVAAFVGYGVANFQAPFFQRVHGLSVSEIATRYAVPIGLAATAGAFTAGWLTQRLSAHFTNAVAWIPAFGFAACVPLYWIGLHTADLTVARVALMTASFFHYFYLGAQYTIGQGVVGARTRATAIAILLFIVNLIGYGLGPLGVGALSDYITLDHLSVSSFAAEMALETCKGRPADLIAALGQAKAQVCLDASAAGLRQALSYAVLLYLLAAVAMAATTRTLQRDMVARLS